MALLINDACYINDTAHFIYLIISKKLNDEDLLVTIDVSSFNTNIQHNGVISAISRSIKEVQSDPLKRMFICRLTEEVLTKNYVEFNSKLHIQKQGTAMGTRMAPSCAKLFQKFFEQEILDKTLRNKKVAQIYRWYDVNPWERRPRKLHVNSK